MNSLMHGLVITLVGMGGTLLSLFLLVLVVYLLKRLFPYCDVQEPVTKEVSR